MGPTWVLTAPDGPHVGHMNLAIGEPYRIPWRRTLPCVCWVVPAPSERYPRIASRHIGPRIIFCCSHWPVYMWHPVRIVVTEITRGSVDYRSTHSITNYQNVKLGKLLKMPTETEHFSERYLYKGQLSINSRQENMDTMIKFVQVITMTS